MNQKEVISRYADNTSYRQFLFDNLIDQAANAPAMSDVDSFAIRTFTIFYKDTVVGAIARFERCTPTGYPAGDIQGFAVGLTYCPFQCRQLNYSEIAGKFAANFDGCRSLTWARGGLGDYSLI